MKCWLLYSNVWSLVISSIRRPARNRIRFNYLYNIHGFNDKGCIGVYLDDRDCWPVKHTLRHTHLVSLIRGHQSIRH